MAICRSNIIAPQTPILEPEFARRRPKPEEGCQIWPFPDSRRDSRKRLAISGEEAPPRQLGWVTTIQNSAIHGRGIPHPIGLMTALSRAFWDFLCSVVPLLWAYTKRFVSMAIIFQSASIHALLPDQICPILPELPLWQQPIRFFRRYVSVLV